MKPTHSEGAYPPIVTCDHDPIAYQPDEASVNRFFRTDRGQFRKLEKREGLSNTSLSFARFLSSRWVWDTSAAGLPSPLPSTLHSFSSRKESEQRPVLLTLPFRQSTKSGQSAWNVIWLQRAERMEEQKQLNPNCSSFHCPPENRGDGGRKLCEFYTLCLSLRFEPWTILIVATWWYLGA